MRHSLRGAHGDERLAEPLRGAGGAPQRGVERLLADDAGVEEDLAQQPPEARCRAFSRLARWGFRPLPLPRAPV